MPEPISAPTSEWQTYVDDAAWMPFSYDPRNDSLVFAHLPREAQREAVFLDNRFIAQAFKSAPARIRSLPLEEIAGNAGPLHFLCHTSFCCSTLLARALDIPGASMGLKEPAVLLSFAKHWTNARQTPGALNALGLTLDLLSRPLSPGEVQIVKPSNVTNHLLPEIMRLRPDARVVILHSELRSFLEATAQRGVEGRLLARQIFQGYAATMPLEVSFSVEEQLLLTDLQIAAYGWLMQTTFLASIARYYGHKRVRTLNCHSMLANPSATLASLGDFFELTVSPEQWSQVVASPVFKHHAKKPKVAFDADAHHAQHAAARATHGAEIDAVEKWARQLAQQSSAVLALGDTLLH
jgi:hypothetical protein